jgi:hypothetical protein
MAKTYCKKPILKKTYNYKGQSELMTQNARLANSKQRPDGYLYILKLKGFDIYKIGVSSNPRRRINDIDSANPFGVELISINHFKNVYEMEECVHDNLRDCELRKEWFKVCPETIKGFSEHLKEMSEEGFYLIRK